MSPTRKLPATVALMSFAAMAIFIGTQLRITTGLGHLLSGSREQVLARVSSELMRSSLSRSMVLVVRADDPERSLAVARRFAAELAEHPEVETIRSGPPPGLAEAVHALYFPHRFAMLSSRPEDEIPAQLDDAGLARAAAELRAALFQPRGSLVESLADADPWQSFVQQTERFEALGGAGLEVRGGHFLDPSDGSAILFLTTRHSAFDASYQAPFEAALVAGFEAARRDTGIDARFERSAIHRFAVSAERRAVEDMQTISIASVLLIVGLFALLFRSPRLLLVSLLPLAGGLLAATTVGILVFGELHVMTLAFGSTLLGICIDYPIHFVVHHTLQPSPGGPSASLERIYPALRMGALTTVAGFLGLAWSDVPGVREIGVFSAVGVAGALVSTRWLMPAFVPAAPRAPHLERRLAEALGSLLDGMRGHRTALVVLTGAGLLVAGIGLPGLTLESDVFALSLPPAPDWIAEEERVRARVGQTDSGRFVVVLGANEEEALQRNDAVFLALERAVEAGELSGMRSLHTFLPSADLQRRNLATVHAQPRLVERTLAALEQNGFRQSAFEAFARDVARTPEPLRFADLEGSTFGDLVSGFRVDLDDGVALLSFLREVTDADALSARLADIEGVHFFDQKRFVANVYDRYRTRTLQLIALGLVAVVALLVARYRDLRWALATAAPALLAAAVTLAALSLAGVAINLLHLLGTLLVLSIGVDYAIFLMERDAEPAQQSATLLSLCLACASTCFAFGLLAFSEFPALQSLGLATGIGVILSLLFAPTLFVLVERREARQEALTEERPAVAPP